MAHSSLRFGIGRFTTEAEVDFVVEHIIRTVTKLREMRYVIQSQAVFLTNSLPFKVLYGRWCRRASTSTRLIGPSISSNLMYFSLCYSYITFMKGLAVEEVVRA
jgi:hypothetical protein